MKKLGEHGFSKFVAQKFGFFDNITGQYDYNVTRDDCGLSSYLERMVGVVMLGRADRKELIDRIDVRQDGHRLKGIDSINAALSQGGRDDDGG